MNYEVLSSSPDFKGYQQQIINLYADLVKLYFAKFDERDEKLFGRIQGVKESLFHSINQIKDESQRKFFKTQLIKKIKGIELDVTLNE